MRLSFAIPIATFAVLAAVFGYYLYQVGPGGKDISEVPSALIDKPAPVFTLPPIPGLDPGTGGRDGFASSELAGKVSLVNVFASWCAPCRVEHPILMQLARQGVPIYGINHKDKPEDAIRFLTDLGNPYRAVGADRDGRVSLDWGVYGYPETFVIDRQGRIRYRHVGPIMPEHVERIIVPLLRKLAA
jgi:cytochrome c biogenesis protein CcmG/thiol:disulfide interchange protein DsbE